MSKKNRERRAGEPAGASGDAGNGGGGVNWLPIILAVAALGLGFVAWTDARKFKDDTAKRLADLDSRLVQVQKDVVAAKRPAQQQQGPDPNKVYTVRTEGSPAKGGANAPVVIAEFSDYQ